MNASPGFERVKRARRSSRLIAAVLLVTGLLAGLTRHADGQVIRIAVADSGSGRPVPGALVSLLDSAAELLMLMRSNAVGAAVLHAPGAGRFAVRVQSIGREVLVSDWLSLADIDTLEVTFRMKRAAVVLSPVLIAAQRDSITPLLPPGINPKAIAGRIIVTAEVAAHSMGARDYVDVLGAVGVTGLTVSTWRDEMGVERRCIASTRSVSRRACVRVFVNNMRAEPASAVDLATPENLDFAVWLRPEDAGVLYGTARPNEDSSVLLLFTKDWRRTHSFRRPP